MVFLKVAYGDKALSTVELSRTRVRTEGDWAKAPCLVPILDKSTIKLTPNETFDSLKSEALTWSRSHEAQF